MNIKAFKLVTGEDILGEVVIDSGNNLLYTLKNPVSIAIVRGQDGRPNVGFAPFPMHAEQIKDSTIDIQSSHVVYSYIPAQDFIDNYNQVFGSGIVVPKQQIITG